MALSDNLIAYYKLDEASGNALDAHGSANFTDNNTVGSTTGKINTSRSFNGTDEYFSSASNPLAGASAFSIQAWVFLNETAPAFDNDAIISGRDGSGNGFSFEIDGSASGLWRFTKTISFSSGNAVSNSTAADSQWLHLVGTVSSGGTVKLYVNGTAQTTTGTKAGSLGASTVNIGTRYDATSTAFFKGLIDELSLWSRELTSAEVTELYNAGSGRDYSYITGGGGAAVASRLMLLGVG